MCSFDNGELPDLFDNYFSEIASINKYQTRLASLQEYYLPRMKTSLGQLSLKYIGPKIWSNIPENLKSLSPYSFRKNIKTPCYLAKNPVDFRSYACQFYVILFRYSCFPLYLLPLHLLTPHSVHKHAFLLLFLLLCRLLILSDVDSMHFVTFLLLLMKRLQSKTSFC